MMWDLRGNSAENTPRSVPSPAFPIPQLAQVPSNNYLTPFAPIGILSAPSSPYYGSYPPNPQMSSHMPHSQPRPHASIPHRHSVQHLTAPRPSGQNHTHSAPHSQPVIGPQHTSNSHTQAAPKSHPSFKYSRCTGRRKALCIGINYTGQSRELRGCVNDATNVRDFLIRYCGYKSEDIVLLTDNSTHARQIPNKKNMLDAMRWLVKSAKADDSLFFHYSGHGGQTKDMDGDEIDGYDEVVYPVDYQKSGHIVDDEMHEIMVKHLPAGCRLTALFDSCHSGTALDLPYEYTSHGRLRGAHISAKARARKATAADVISLSGCKDSQTSADTYADGVAVGAMSHAFISVMILNNKNQLSYQNLLKAIRDVLRQKYSQKPQLASSHPIDTNLRFIL